MKERKDIEKIRELLGRWYSGEASPGEEQQLRERLLSTPNLPDDLREERDLLAALAEAGSVLAEMPEEYETRINAALEKEMAADRRNASAAGRLFNRRLWIRSLSGVAACLAIGFAAHQVWNAPDIEIKEPVVKVAMNISQPVASYDSLAVRSLTLTPQEGKNVKAAATPKSRKTAKTAPRLQRRAEVVEDTYDDDDAGYLSAAEEERLARSNYRVVRDEAEADELLNSIFSRMENTMAMESSRISKIELEYDSEMSRLTQIENVEQYKEPYHDETPL